ncbi:uncharacterized protein LOC131637764 [Vicia villosa]|uniref:uncharacterized protein LOC131637764 n=1 Tax=Vicia villosa TaxID=3911 RepID=UPI00273B2EA1|nr:uncharacterized protein LOC131637764 [Vicia villosa]
MKKVSNLQKKMAAAQKGEQVTANFRLPLFRSSAELAKKYDIKCEMVNNNNREGTSKVGIRPPFVPASRELFNLSKFETAASKIDSSADVFYPTKMRTRQTTPRKVGAECTDSRTMQQVNPKTGPEIASRTMQQVNPKTGPEIASRTRQQLAKKTGPEIVDSRTRQQQGNDKQSPSSASAKQPQGSAKQQQVSSAKQVSSKQQQVSSAKKVPSAKQQVSSAKQQASSANQKRPSIASQQLPSSAKQNTSTAKQQPKEKRVADTADSRSNQNRMKRAMIEVDGNSGTGQGSGLKKTKRSPMCKSTSIEEFLKENGENSEEDECENLEEEENMMGEEENTQQNGSKQTEGASKKRTRGPTKCLKIHARKSADREEVVLDDDGEPIGPNDRTVTDLSCFLGTVARNSDLCPLVFTNFKALKKANKDRIWEFVTDKFIIPENGRRAVFSRINDAWRRFKKDLKKSCFLKYTTMSERWKHRPQTVPEVHFKQLISYWKNNNIQKISKINAVNRAKQKYMHRMGPTNFARIRAKLRAKKEDGKEVSQAEMFIETRQSRKGKQPDEET